MRGRFMLAVFVILAVSVHPACAGLYCTGEPIDGPQPTGGQIEPMNFRLLKEAVSKFSLEIVKPDSQLRKDYEQKRDDLQRKARTGRITTEEKVNLSYYLIRLGQAEEAVALLRPVAANERQNFMVYGNLGTAQFLTGQPGPAAQNLSLARSMIPEKWPGLSSAQLAWYREMERAQMRLVLLRSKDPSKGAKPLDALFSDDQGPVEFVGESGEYEPGQLAAREKTKLPANALAIVQQLVVWFPQDTRLYWLLAELYNAHGDLSSAASILEECIWTRRFDAPGLKEHRHLIQEAKQKAETPPPRPSLLPEQGQLWLVGGLAGMVALVLAYFQVREFGKRRRTRT